MSGGPDSAALVLLGYAPKHATPLVSEAGAAYQALCASCASKYAEGFWEEPRNAVGLMPRQAPALAIARGQGAHLLAFAAWPEFFLAGGERQPWNPATYRGGPVELPSEPLVRLGFDLIELVPEVGFGCSPLTCSMTVDEVGANGYGLLETLEEALHWAPVLAARPGLEPPPYYLVEVRGPPGLLPPPPVLLPSGA